MADFRKLLLALMAGALLFTTVASAADYACAATAVPTLVRSEGLAEPMGDILLHCDGTIPSGGILANIRLKLGTNVTSNPVVSTTANAVYGDLTDAMLILDNGATGFRGYYDTDPLRVYSNGTQNLYQAIKIADDEIEWQGIWLAAVGSTGYTKTIRLTNVRGNAYSRGDQATIMAYVNITGATTVPVDNNQLVVADTRPGMTFTVTSESYKNCIVPRWHLHRTTGNYRDIIMGEPDGAYSVLTFTEGFASAFRPKGDANVDNIVPGGSFRNESGFAPGSYSGELVGASIIGQAAFGTRLFVRLKNIPSDVTAYVPTQIVTPYGMIANLVDAPGAAGASDTYSSGSVTDTVAVTNNRFAYEITDVSADSYASMAFEEAVNIPVFLEYTAPATVATATASGTLAPISTVGVMDYTALEPRFVDKGVDKDIFSIGYCRTVLLFPYVTNQAGFDTGIAISNTSLDPLFAADDDYVTEGQSGTCKLYYYGSTLGNGASPAAQTTPTVPAGGQFVMALSGGGFAFGPDTAATNCATCGAPLFQGYVFALCDFQYAHGFAFVSDMGVDNVAMGYLALVVPDTGYKRIPTNSVWNSWGDMNAGEQLSQ